MSGRARLNARKLSGMIGPVHNPIILLKLLPELRAAELEQWSHVVYEMIDGKVVDVYPHGRPSAIGAVVWPATLSPEFADLDDDLRDCWAALATPDGHYVRARLERDRRLP